MPVNPYSDYALIFTAFCRLITTPLPAGVALAKATAEQERFHFFPDSAGDDAPVKADETITPRRH